MVSENEGFKEFFEKRVRLVKIEDVWKNFFLVEFVFDEKIFVLVVEKFGFNGKIIVG